jgi:glycosyl transferase family 28
MNLQEVLDPIDVFRRATGVRIQDVYNSILKSGWTLGSTYLLKVLQAAVRIFHDEEVKLIADYWSRKPVDMAVSLVPHFNRALRDGLLRASPQAPFVTILTDLADYPPHFWMEPQDQFFICGSEKAVEQARLMEIPEDKIHRSSGMILHPRFYDPVRADRATERRRLGLHPDVPVGLLMFGGQGSDAMLEIANRLSEADLRLQLICICGRNQKLAEELRAWRGRFPIYVEGFTSEVPYYMHLSDFFIGKPGPGSISEALHMKLPVVVEENVWTLPQERYNALWIREQFVGLVVKDFRQIAPAVEQLLQPETYARLRTNIAALDNRAVLEIPAILSRILETARAAHLPSRESAIPT